MCQLILTISPRARGKGGGDLQCGGLEGITPACAGKSRWDPPRSGTARDHPRVRGEKPSAAVTVMVKVGSPPRARGKVKKALYEGAAVRDHPRVRGEKLAMPESCWPGKGSPPRARGKGHGGRDKPQGRRITPACAGKSYSRRLWIQGGKDHPRVRGEKPNTAK